VVSLLLLETFYWTYIMEVSTSFLLIPNDWKSGGRCFLKVLFDFKERCLLHALFLIVSTMFS
jgi:hypothetical protein